MCYEFDAYFSKARIAEQLRKKAEVERGKRSENPVPARPEQTEEPAKTPDTVPA